MAEFYGLVAAAYAVSFAIIALNQAAMVVA
jgi:hypothetical protein